jgi:tRNA G18 (ribose-2'-O)-methylase SpoU
VPNIIAIDDPSDPRVEAYLDIRERDLVGRAGLFVAEGRVVIEKVLGEAAADYRLDSLLVAAHRIDTSADLLARVDDDTPIYAAAQNVLDAVAGFPLHRGLIAIGRRRTTPSAQELLAGLPERADILILSAIANHDNIGGLFRNAAAFGVKAILLDADCCDPLYRKAIRVSVGAALLVPFAKLPRETDLPALLASHGFEAIALTPRGAIPLAQLKPARRNAVLLGAEGPGLPDALLAQATTIRIPMVGGFDSLNVATTSGIVLHHLIARQGTVGATA